MSALMGGCSTPISALAQVNGDEILFEGNVVSPDGKEKLEIKRSFTLNEVDDAGGIVAKELIGLGADKILNKLSNFKEKE
ncbi:hypothetical protein [Niabella ginsengisoli]|uniref:Porphobilinogen deaminase C-terminal domain-containing protein n=1 Tax=Niabella ginsengisoli TaxID=522298 RepID=A0ABS9SEX5_9BACT|nr:hypothetical protein [Niabella ginsengisoli]MCH5596890.1 hypothetical protein [Niabella ginsengisoli]